MAFNRKIEALIGAPGEIGTKFTGIRIVFLINKTGNESPNKAEIKLYNITVENATKISRVNNKLILRAGYIDEGNIRNIFFGDIQSVSTKLERTERITEIMAFDGSKNNQEKNISLSYAEGTPIITVFFDIVAAFGFPLAGNPQIPNLQYANGYAFIGKVKDALTEVVNYMGKTWAIQNEQLVILSPDEIIQRTGLLLSPDTGLLQLPEILDDKDKEQVENVPKRYRLKSLLYPQLSPGVQISLKSMNANGIFKVETVEFEGDSFESDFLATTEVRRII